MAMAKCVEDNPRKQMSKRIMADSDNAVCSIHTSSSMNPAILPSLDCILHGLDDVEGSLTMMTGHYKSFVVALG